MRCSYSTYRLVKVLLSASILQLCSSVKAAPVHDAVESGDLSELESILQADPAAVNARTSGGSTPLHMAVGIKNPAIVGYLIDKGADVNLKTQEGYTPLHWAAYFDAGSVAELLIAKGAKIDEKTVSGVTPLQLALSENAQSVAEVLVSQTKSAYNEPALDDRFLQAETARASGDLVQAYKIFSQLLEADPGNQKVNFAYGMTCMAMKDYSRARFAFERLLMSDPSNHRARLEMARAQAASQQYDGAIENLRKVLAEELSPKVRENVELFLAEVNRAAKTSSFSGRLDLGYFDDSNVNVGPDSDIVSIAPIIFGSLSVDQLTLEEASLPSESAGYFASLVLSGSTDIGARGGWLASADAMVYNNWLVDAEAYESRYYMLSLGGIMSAGTRTLRAPLRISHIDSGGEPLVDMAALAPVYRATFADGRVAFTTTATLELRDYVDLNDRDGVFVSLGESVKMIARDGKSSVGMGLTFAYDGTDAGIYEYTGYSWVLNADQVLPFNFIGYAKLSSSRSDYAEKESLAPEEREDSQTQVAVGLTRRVGERAGFDVNYQNTKNSSTFGLYQYERDVVTAALYYTF